MLRLFAATFLYTMLVWQPLVALTGGANFAPRSKITVRTGIYDPNLDAKVEALLAR